MVWLEHFPRHVIIAKCSQPSARQEVPRRDASLGSFTADGIATNLQPNGVQGDDAERHGSACRLRVVPARGYETTRY